MKTASLKYLFTTGIVFILIACSTKKNSFISRNSHALSTKYNILYNGGVALDKGITDLKLQYKDNFWEILPIERMQITKEALDPTKDVVNPNFDRAETKAIKAIQKHAMNIAGSEKNPQMDEAYLMLGKSRYYSQRFVPALEAFNYILYKYPNSDKIYEAKIWREKTNMRMDNDALAVKNLRILLKEIKFKDQIYADANAALTQAFLNLEEKDSAVAKLKLARDFTKSKEEKSRYHFILGQLYEKLGLKDSAFASFQAVIDMKRNAAKQYVIQAHAKQARQFDLDMGDSVVFLKKMNSLLKDRENRPLLDVLNHQMALYYDKQKKQVEAKKYYNISLRKKSDDQYLIASNYRNLADIHFYNAKYVTAGKYYDSTLVQLKIRTREYNTIKKKRENLVDVIKYEGIASRSDSIISVFFLSKKDRIKYYEEYILKLQKEEADKKALKAKEAKNAENPLSEDAKDGADPKDNPTKGLAFELKKPPVKAALPAAYSGNATPSNFYFYNQTTVAFGKIEFKKTWGERSLKDNWRVAAAKTAFDYKESSDSETDLTEDNLKKIKTEEKYTPEFYIKKLPQKQTEIDSIAKERNFAYFQLGVIYKEKFKEYQLAATKLEALLENKPEDRLVLPSMYNLYKIYESIAKNKAVTMKAKIISQFPDSRYAQILGNTNAANSELIDTPEKSYKKLYEQYVSGDFKTVLLKSEEAIEQYNGEEIVSKFELLKANTIGKIKGIAAYKTALNYVSLSYPNNVEGKEAEKMLNTIVPKFEDLKFYEAKPLSWKILYKADNPDDATILKLQETLKKFITDRTSGKIGMSLDLYTMDKNFIVIHGIKSEDAAKGYVTILKEYKDYKIAETAYIISNDNYKIVQIKKNFEDYLNTKPTDPLEKSEPDPTMEKPNTQKPNNVLAVKNNAIREEFTDDVAPENDPPATNTPDDTGTPPQDVKKEKR